MVYFMPMKAVGGTENERHGTKMDGVEPSSWKLILTDCYNASTNIKVTLKSGKEFTGFVHKHPSKFLHNLIQMGDRYERVIFTIDVYQIAAVTEMR